MPIAVFAGRLPARMAHGRFTYRRPSRLIQTPRPSPKPCSIGPIRVAVVRWQSARPTARPATCTRCTNGDPQIPIAPAEPGAPRPATPFPGGFRTPALGASGGVRAGPPSETRHTSCSTTSPSRSNLLPKLPDQPAVDKSGSSSPNSVQSGAVAAPLTTGQLQTHAVQSLLRCTRLRHPKKAKSRHLQSASTGGLPATSA